ncbi:2'-5' RNA ligase family protein [Streptomyces tunisiensis]|uniref:2'-5' RNA ligase family protein n=1 Tax=Streptomyces tunisiensis TaxID=948699 RepID=UPI00403D5743
MLTFPGSPALADLALHCQQHLARLGLDPVPDEGLHITLTRVGSAAALPLSRLDDVISMAAPLLPAPSACGRSRSRVPGEPYA